MSDETPTETVPVSSETTALDVLQRQVESLTDRLEKITSERDEFSSRSAHYRPSAMTSWPRLRLPTPRPPGSASWKPRSATASTSTSSPSWQGRPRPRPKPCVKLWRDAKDRGYEAEGDEADEKALQAIVAKLKTEVDYAFDLEGTAPPGQPGRPQGPLAGPSTDWKCAARNPPVADGKSGTRAPTARSSRRRCGPIPSSCSTQRTAR